MSGAEILSLIGIIIGLAVLVVLVMKGINIYVVAFYCEYYRGCFRSNEFI